MKNKINVKYVILNTLTFTLIFFRKRNNEINKPQAMKMPTVSINPTDIINHKGCEVAMLSATETKIECTAQQSNFNEILNDHTT